MNRVNENFAKGRQDDDNEDFTEDLSTSSDQTHFH